jgi:SET domain-containing protein
MKKRARSQPLNDASPARTSTAQLLEVRESGVHGTGVYAAKPIRKGARIIEYTGRRIPWSSVPDDSEDGRTYYFGLDNGKEVIDPAVDGNEARWINHSCEPNCEAIEEDDERVFIFALRNIQPGEELFYDYQLEIEEPINDETKKESACLCRSKKCRGTMLDLSKE